MKLRPHPERDRADRPSRPADYGRRRASLSKSADLPTEEKLPPSVFQAGGVPELHGRPLGFHSIIRMFAKARPNASQASSLTDNRLSQHQSSKDPGKVEELPSVAHQYDWSLLMHRASGVCFHHVSSLCAGHNHCQRLARLLRLLHNWLAQHLLEASYSEVQCGRGDSLSPYSQQSLYVYGIRGRICHHV